MNVVGSKPDGWWRDLGGCKASDSGVLGHSTGGARLRPCVLGLLAFRHLGADPGTWPAAPGLTVVVTSDADLVRRVRERGADVVGASQFRRRLED